MHIEFSSTRFGTHITSLLKSKANLTVVKVPLLGPNASVTNTPLDIPAIIKACGFKDVIVAETNEEIKNGIARLRKENKVAMVLHTKQGSREDLGRPTTTPQENKEALMKKLGVR